MELDSKEQKCERGVCTTSCRCFGCFDTCATCIEPRCPVIHVQELLRRGNRKVCLIGSNYPTRIFPPDEQNESRKPADVVRGKKHLQPAGVATSRAQHGSA